MSGGADGQLRQSQVITTYGPGALIDLPEDAAIVGGLETWPNPSTLEEIVDPRLSGLLQSLTDVPYPRMYAPPPQPEESWLAGRGIGAWRFPEWFVVHEADDGDGRQRSRRLVHRKSLERGRFEREAGRAHPVRAGLSAGPCGRPRLERVRAWLRRALRTSTLAGRARHHRRLGRSRRALRVPQVPPPP